MGDLNMKTSNQLEKAIEAKIDKIEDLLIRYKNIVVRLDYHLKLIESCKGDPGTNEGIYRILYSEMREMIKTVMVEKKGLW